MMFRVREICVKVEIAAVKFFKPMTLGYDSEYEFNYMEPSHIFAFCVLVLVYISALANNLLILKLTPWTKGEDRPIPMRLIKILIITDIVNYTMFFIYFIVVFVHPSYFSEKFARKCEWSVMQYLIHMSICLMMVILSVMSAYDYLRFLFSRFCRWPIYVKIFCYFYMAYWILVIIAFVIFQLHFLISPCPSEPYSTDELGRIAFLTMFFFGLFLCIMIYWGAIAFLKDEKDYLYDFPVFDGIFMRREEELDGFIREVDTLLYFCVMHGIGIMPAVLQFAFLCEGCYFEARAYSSGTKFWIYYGVTMFVLLKSALAPLVYYYRIKKVQTAVHKLLHVLKKFGVKIAFEQSPKPIYVMT